MEIRKIKYLLFSCLALLLSCANNSKQELSVDVLVIGGTTSGISAGISSARLGASTLIVEETPWLGGMFTAQGVGACDGNHNLHSGIWNEFRDKLRAHYGGIEALETGWVSNTLFEPHIGDSIFKSMAKAEGRLQTIHHYHFKNVLKEGDKVIGAIFENADKKELVVNAKVVIDATDIGESLKLAGADYRLGMDSKKETEEENAPDIANDIVQDITWVAILKDFGEGADKTIPQPSNYNKDEFAGSCDITADGKAIDCEQMLTYGKMPNGKYMINWPTVGNDIYMNVVEMSREEREIELQKAKDVTMRFVYYIQHELGYKHLGLADDEFDTDDKLAYLPYHREGRRVVGEAYLTYNHVAQPYDQKEFLYRTGVSVGDYPVDHHHDKNKSAPHVGFPPVPSFNIPLGSLIPKKIDGLIVSDKAISVSNLINGSTRLQPVVLLTGQAAGVLAALSVKENKTPRNINIRQVQETLLNLGVYIMPLFDVSPEDKDFKVIQKISATGILRTEGEAYQWANRTWFYPEKTISEKEFTEGLNNYDDRIEILNSTSILTSQKAVQILANAGIIIKNTQDVKALPITKRDLALLLNESLDPFSKEVGFNGYYKK